MQGSSMYGHAFHTNGQQMCMGQRQGIQLCLSSYGHLVSPEYCMRRTRLGREWKELKWSHDFRMQIFLIEQRVLKMGYTFIGQQNPKGVHSIPACWSVSYNPPIPQVDHSAQPVIEASPVQFGLSCHRVISSPKVNFADPPFRNVPRQTHFPLC